MAIEITTQFIHPETGSPLNEEPDVRLVAASEADAVHEVGQDVYSAWVVSSDEAGGRVTRVDVPAMLFREGMSRSELLGAAASTDVQVIGPEERHETRIPTQRGIARVVFEHIEED